MACKNRGIYKFFGPSWVLITTSCGYGTRKRDTPYVPGNISNMGFVVAVGLVVVDDQ